MARFELSTFEYLDHEANLVALYQSMTVDILCNEIFLKFAPLLYTRQSKRFSIVQIEKSAPISN